VIDQDKEGYNSLIECYKFFHIIIIQSCEIEILYKSKTIRESLED